MAEIGVEPVAANPLLARHALERDLARRSDDDPVLERISELVVHVGLQASGADGTTDDFLLRLGFTHYDDWPPSAQFVNPKTRVFVLGEDNQHVPRIEGANELAVHLAYQRPARGTVQLICCSFTLEFYEVQHAVKPQHLWQPGTHTLWSTLNAIRHHLRQPFYKGRFA